MPRPWLYSVLAIFLFLWEPLRVGGELTQTLPTMGMRGWPAAIELAGHAAVAVLAASSGWALWNGFAHAPALAIVALSLSAVVSVQSLYWTWLPRQTPPGAQLPLAALAVAHAGAWVGYVIFRLKTSTAA